MSRKGPPSSGGESSHQHSLDDALSNVISIRDLVLPVDPEPMINAATQSIQYESDLDTSFVDRNAFASVASRFMEEATHQAKMNELLHEAKQYAGMLYTWRSCSLGIPPVKSGSQDNRELYERTCDVMEAEVAKLRRFMDFQARIADQFCAEVTRLCQGKADFVSEQYLHTLGSFVSMFATLDELKNIKASIKNDYSTYRRASGILKRITDTMEVQASEQLSMFLATNNSILTQVKTRLKKISGYEGVMCDIIMTCVHMFENHLWLRPREKQGIVKVVGFCLYLMDTETCNINRLDSKKKLNLSRIDKIFKQVEVVPLFGDMMIGPFRYIENTPNYDPDKWPKCLSEENGPQSELGAKQMAALREEHTKLVCELTWMAKLKATVEDINKKHDKSDKKAPSPVTDHQVLYDLAHKALVKLSSWTAKVTELYSWKLLHPTDPSRNKKCPKDAENYERATRYNYTSEEKYAIVEVLAMIKGVQQLLTGLSESFSTAVHHHIYTSLQDFVQVQLREPLRKALKQQKKDTVKNVLLAVRDVCQDLAKGVDPSKDPLLSQKKKDAETGHTVEVPKKAVLPSTTQIYMVRTMLESLIEKGDKNMGRKSPRKDMDAAHVQMIEQFLKTSFFWKYLINFDKNLQACCDLSQFWYREFYLEMTKGQKIQFPIEMSMPWILTSHILDNKHPTMVEYVLYPFDLYNDGADWALRHFKKQYLFDEIEAEVNLCFDQLIYQLSDQIFAHYKWLAGCQVMERTLRTACRKEGFVVKEPPQMRFQSLMRKQHVQLLGRTVDLKSLITQRINENFLKALKIAISRFECSDITGIMELQGLIQCNRAAHLTLSKYLALADFDTLLAEANHLVSAPVSRIALYVFVEINADFLTQYCYNASTDRFVHTKLPFADKSEHDKPPTTAPHNLWGTKQLNNCYSTIYERYSGFIGPPHFQALADLIGYQDMAFLLRELLKVMQSIIQDSILPYFKTLSRVMPKRCKLPRYDYTSPAILEYFQAQLTDITNYSDLQPKVFQVLRELGNGVLFCICMEKALNQKEVTEITNSALFQNIFPKPFVDKKGKSREELDKALKSLLKEAEEKHKNQNVVPMIQKIGTAEQKTIVKDMALLTREKLCCGLSIFRTILKKLQDLLADPEWQGVIPNDGVLNVVENLEFHRFYSALQFIFCVPRPSGVFTVEELFGEGLHWAGCTLIMLLGQQRRFEVMDYSYHLMKVNRVDMKDQDCRGIPLKKMVERIRKFQILNGQIFASLSKHVLTVDSRDAHRANLEEISPPSPPDFSTTATGGSTSAALPPGPPAVQLASGTRRGARESMA